MARARAGGADALRHRPPPGAARRLSVEPLAQLPGVPPRGPEADGVRGQRWPRSRVAALIRLALGGSSHPRHVGRLRKAMRWSPPQPARRARQRDEVALAGAARGDLARDHKGAEAQEQTILLIDESGFYPLPSVARTYAPVGQTPILRDCCTRAHLSAISALSPGGKLYFQSQDHARDSLDVVAFLEHLLREVSGRMVLIWDGPPIHRSQVIKDFLAAGAGQRLHLERLPAYAPELNPGEGLWQQLKGVELRHVCCFNIPHPTHEVRDAVKRVRRKARLITSVFRGAKL